MWNHIALTIGVSLAACSVHPPADTAILEPASLADGGTSGTESADAALSEFFQVATLPANTKWNSLPVKATGTPGLTIVATTDEGKSSIAVEQGGPGKYCMDVELKTSATTQVTFSAKDKDGNVVGMPSMQDIVQAPATTTDTPEIATVTTPAANVALGGLAAEDGTLSSNTQIGAINDGNTATYASIAGWWPDSLWYSVRLNNESQYKVAKIVVRSLGEADGSAPCQNGPLQVWYTISAAPSTVDTGSLSDSPHGAMDEWFLVPNGTSDGSQGEFDIDLSQNPIDATQIAVTFESNGCGHFLDHEYYSLSEIEVWTPQGTQQTPIPQAPPTCANNG